VGPARQHDFETAAPGLAGRLRWLARAAAVAASPVFEARRLLSSRRVQTARERLLAAVALVRIRMYRASRMLAAPAWPYKRSIEPRVEPDVMPIQRRFSRSRSCNSLSMTPDMAPAGRAS
jgi:hypothetical protein